MATTFTRLLSPIKIGPKVIKNRILVTAHVPGLEKNNLISDEYILYQHAKAKGGAGLQISGATAIHSTGSVGSGRGLNGANPKVIIGYKRLAKAIHEEGGRFLIQLGHSAATVNDQEAGRPLIAPSSIQSQLIRETPEIMTITMIEEIIHSYYLSAKHVKEGDLDGVEILAAFGFLVGAFMSPFTNKRTDKYGGSLENRLRFPLEVVDAVRKGVGKDLIVGIRLPGDERVEGGLNQDSMISISEVLCRNSELDYLNIIVGTNYDRIQRMEHWPPTPAPPGLFVPLAAAIKAKVAIPVFTTGRITDPVLAETILANNHADMIGMTRAQIADPKLVQKIMENRLDDIRPCIGANLCISQATEAKPIRCIHNPIIGRETLWQGKPESKKLKKVTIIGGGPAGLEAARVAAKIGHHVTLFEQSNKLGGQFRIWSKAPLTAEFIKSINWYEAQLRKLQVKIRLNRKIEENEIEKFDTDVIIMATGSKAFKENLTDGNIKSEILVLSPEDVFLKANSIGLDLLAKNFLKVIKGNFEKSTEYSDQQYSYRARDLRHEVHLSLDENLFLRNKILAANLTGNNIYNFPINGFFSFNDNCYEKFEKKLLSIIKMSNKTYFKKIGKNTDYCIIKNKSPSKKIISVIKSYL